MRLSNRNNKPLFSFIYSLVGIIFILGVIAYVLEISKFDVFGKKAWILLAIPSLLFLLLYILGRPVFEYDSDGEALNFRNNHILYILARKDAKDEFPKYKLLKFNIINVFVFKRLYVYILSKKNHIVILKYDINYLSKKQIKDLKFSLNKVVKANKEIRHEHEDNTVAV
ncbi:hypothetical protein [Epilithonimonas arachidiradicis]|uniref:PH (Pleckstrin Homology) domain-containing protein n=1 Tax=Epilithonimonas arachidiradicis TaxID=1617282 RepID=A0A420DA36_9FLAO|nr:hypothetical protein [Epilithonimonas arachidiradicis]RKE88082.1 hypothetical protein BXY58_1213 [Epilithonimonas arachidiradicis]GGG51499.1 hypothetical protein GCM10007332_11490 [Epilithonimonas arachidiradicis]